jgi:hypothetical protein
MYVALRYVGTDAYGAGHVISRKVREPMLVQKILCVFNRHEPDRHKAVWDGLHYVARCRACGREIYRVKSKSWRAIGSG